jgi:para-aminobenzoate synthetase component 1
VIVRALTERKPFPALVRAAAGQPLPCALRLVAEDGVARWLLACAPSRRVLGDDVAALADAWAEAQAGWQAARRPGLPIAVGYLGYDLGARFERIRGADRPAAPWPLLEFRFYDALLACEPDSGRLQVWGRDEPAVGRLVEALLARPGGAPPEAVDAARGPLAEMEPAADHLASVAKALEYIRAGDIYQVNLARRLGCAYPVRPGQAPGASLLLRLEALAPAPYAFWLADGETGSALLGNSPERFLHRAVDGMVSTSPIKGTRPRDPGAPERNARALAASAKDWAEHVMIVDLERSDLGRVCRTGSVAIVELGRMLDLPTVHHLESTVRGWLRPGVGLPELLRATFPGGSVTGAPKIRAMEIIEELEPARRGPYCGATGWLGAGGDLDLAVAIRTAVLRDGRLTLWVGGGIVADSLPEAELAETWDKARAFSRALG